jgi:regulator of protease activity HflC (stomatin/prohibitin superfamily)
MIKYPWFRGERSPPESRCGLRGFLERHLPSVAVAVMMVLLIGFVLYPYMVITVPSGQVGVLWKRIPGPGIYCWCFLSRGTVLNPQEIRNEGLHVIWPWDKLFLYDLRLQSTTEKYNAISKDGVTVTVEINIRYQLNHGSVAVFHKFIGPDYLKTLVAPEIGSQARVIISQYGAQDVYISREKIEGEIKKSAQRGLGEHLNGLFQPEASEQLDADAYKRALQGSIQILDTLVLSVVLPDSIVAAINRQTEQYYRIMEYRYRAEREAEESKRKQIEANGIAAFQRTVSQGISESYLRWRGIEATLALAQSTNTKIVIIGNGKDGLPIILGNVDTPGSPSMTPQAKPPANEPPTTDKQTSGAGSMQPSDSSQGGNTPTAPETKPDKQPSSLLDLSDIQAIVSRFSDAFRTTGSGKSTETAGATAK